MASNVTVSFTPANVTVDETNLTVNVSQTTTNVVVSNVASIANANLLLDQLSVIDAGGDGSLTYSNTTGIFTYTGPSASEVRAHFSNTSPVTYDNSTGVIGIDSNAIFTGKTTDDLTEGSTNLYYTTDRANTAIGAYTGNLTAVNTTGNITTTANISGSTLKATGPLGLVVNGNATIGGNLDVTGNINSETVVDLFVEDRNITMQYGITGAPAANSHLFVDRGTSPNVAIFWDEVGDKWKINNTDVTDSSYDLTPLAELATGILELAGTGGNVNTDISYIQLATDTQAGNAGIMAYNSTDPSRTQPFMHYNGVADRWEVGVGNIYNTTGQIALEIYDPSGASSGDVNVKKGNFSVGDGNITISETGANENNGQLFANSATLSGLDSDGHSLKVAGNILNTSNNLIYNPATADLYTDNVYSSAVTAGANIDFQDQARFLGNIIPGNINGVLSGTEWFINVDTKFTSNLKVQANARFDVENNVTSLFGDGSFIVGPQGQPASEISLRGDSANVITPQFDVFANIQMGTGGFTINGGQAGVVGSGNIEWGSGNINAAYFDGDGSNITGLTTSIVSEGTNLYYTTDRANSAIQTYLPNTNVVISSDSNITTTANVSADTVLTDKIESGASANLNLKGQADGIHFDTTIDSVESRIVDLDTTGYSIADVELPADFTAGTNTPSALLSINLTTGNATVEVRDIFGQALAGLGVQVPALRGPSFSSATGGASTGPICAPNTGNVDAANVLHAFTTAGTPLTFAPFAIDIEANGLANATAGLYGQDKGWGCFDVTTSSIATLFPANAYVTGMTSGTITFSEPALVTASARTVILSPGMAQTSDSKTTVKYYANTHTGSNSEFISNYGRLSSFDLPETLSNTTFDAISYGNTSSVTTTVTMKNISDFAGSDESATRFKRGLLIGAATTPDPASARETLNQPSTLGVILESDGESYNDGLNTPAPRFLINNYSGGMDDLTSYPVWGQVGATGNLELDLPQLKAPSLTLKSFRGAKSTANTTSYLMQAGDVVGKIAFSPAQTTGTGNQGVDGVNPPAAITVDVGSANINTGVANAYMHITTTPYSGTNLGYSRNNANADSGANQQTNFTTKDGNLTLAAQTSGMITLAPTPDYGDAANSTVWTRYPGTTHEYHTFLNTSFNDISSKTGTLVEIQPKSGTTTGSGGLAYDSKGDATLRFNVHESNSSLKKTWDIFAEQSSGNLDIADNTTGTPDVFMHLNGGRVFIDKSLRLQNLTTTEINAIASPESGDMVYNTTLNQVCFYNGTAWQKITSATM